MNDELKIIAVASLDVTKTKDEIQNQLNNIEKQLRLQINVDAKLIQQVANDINVLQNQVNKKAKSVRIIDDKTLIDTINNNQKLFTSVEKAIEAYSKLGTVTSKKIFDPKTQELTAFNLEIQKGEGLVEKLRFELAKLNNVTVEGKDTAYILTKREESNKSALEMERALQQTIVNRQRELKKLEEAQARAANKGMELVRKEQKAQEELNQKLEHQIELFKRQMQVNIQNLQRTHGGYINKRDLESLKESLNDLTRTTPNVRREMDLLSMRFREIKADAMSAAGALQQSGISLGEAFSVAFSKFSIWLASGTVIMQTLNFFRDGIKFVNELNKSLTEISIVTGQSQEQVSALGEEYNKLARQLSVTTKDVAEAAVEFYRQGLVQEEVMKRTKVAIQYAKISSLDFKDASEILTATVNSMGVDIERASDVFSYLGDATATGADEIGRAFQKMGGSVGALGISFEKAASWVAVLSSRTREGAETIGQSIKSILARVQQLKEEGYVEEDGTQINEVATALSKVGIQLVDANGQFRNFGTVMDELGAKWKTLDSRTKAYLATVIAGTYQQSRFLNLMEGYEETIPLYEQALESAGTTQQKFNLATDSIEAKLNEFKAAWEDVWISAFQSDAIQTGISILTKFADALDLVIDHFGLLPPLLGVVGAGFLTFRIGTDKIIASGALLLKTLKGVPVAFRTLDSALAASALKMNLMNATSKALTVSINALKSAFITASRFIAGIALPFAGFMLLGSAISKVSEIIIEHKQRSEELKESFEQSAESLSKNREEINKLLQEYEALANVKRNNEQEERYVELQNKLAQLLPIVKMGEDAKGNAIIANSNIIKNYIEQLERQLELEREINAQQAPLKIEENRKQIESLKEGYQELEEMLHRLQEKYQNYLDSGNDKAAERVQSMIEPITSQMRKSLSEQTDLLYEIQQAYASVISQVNGLSEADISWISQIATDSQMSTNEVKKLAEQVANLRSALGKDFNFGNLTYDQIQAIDSVVQSVKNGSYAWEQFNQKLRDVGLETSQISLILGTLRYSEEEVAARARELGISVDQLNPVYNEFGELINYTNNALQNQSEGLANTGQKVDELVSKYNTAISNIRSLNEIINLLNEGQGITADKIGFLLEKYPHLLAYLNDETALRRAIQQEIKNEAKVAEQVVYQKLMLDQNYIKNAQVLNSDFANWLRKNYGIDLQNYKNLAEAKAAVDNQLIRILGDNWSRYFKVLSNGMVKLSGVEVDNLVRGAMHGSPEANRILNDLYARMQQYNKLVQQISNGFKSITVGLTGVGTSFKSIGLSTPKISTPKSSSSKSSSSKKKDTEERRVDKYVTDQYAQAIDNLNVKLKESESRLASMSKTSSSYRKELQYQIGLYQQMKKLADEERKRLEARNASLRKQLASMGNFNKLSAENKEKYNEIAREIDDNIQKINDLRQTVIDANNNIREANEKIRESYEEIADKVIEIYKEMYEKQQEEALKAIDKELDALEKKHNRKLKLLDEELEAYEKIINKQMEALDKQKDETEWQEELNKKQEERQKLLNEYNKWAKDTSPEGRLRAKELLEQIAEIDEEIEKMRRDRQYELQKETLEDLLEQKQEQIDAQKELEDQYYEEQKEKLEKQREEINKYYENLLNDERKWADIRKQILAGNINAINKDLQNFASFVNKNMESIGKSISQNLLDKIKEAQNLLKGINGQKAPSTTSGTSSGGSSGGSSSGGKSSSGGGSSGSSKNNLPLRKKPGGFAKPKGGWNLNSVVDYLKSKGYYAEFSDREKLWKYFKGSGKYVGSSSQNSWLLKKLKAVGLETGGYTGDWVGNYGKWALLHKKELVLNKEDTSMLFKAIKLLDNFKDLLKPYIKMPTVPKTTTINNSGDKYISISMPVTIENLNGTKEGANEFLNIINNNLKQIGVPRRIL